MSSASNLALLVVLAEVATTAEFAALGTAYTWLLGCAGVVRTVIGDDLQLRTSTASNEYSAVAVVAIAPALFATAGSTFILLAVNASHSTVAAFAIASGLIVSQELVRVILLTSRVPWWSLLGDTAWLGIFVLTWALTPVRTPESGVLAWSVGAALSIVVMNRGRSPSSAPMPRFADSLRRRSASLTNFGAVVAGTTIMMLLLTSFDEGEAARARASLTLLAPIGTIAGGLRFTFFRRLSGGHQVQRDQLRYFLLLVCTIAGTVTGILTLEATVGLADRVEIARLGLGLLPHTALVWIAMAAARPVIDAGLGSPNAQSLSAGRVAGETLALCALAMTGGAYGALGYVYLRSLSPAGAVAGLFIGRRVTSKASTSLE